MRNLKRALSLVLASVMILGLMIVGSNAMTADFGDVDQIDPQYTEAIDVLTTVGLIDGMDDDANSFNPLGTLTRAQAAKLLSVMLLGEANADKLGTNNQIFQDVPKGNWAAGYIAYCNSVGILAGNGDGTFNPEGKLTGVQFGKMLLVALGYRADIEKYVNDPAWETNVATDMLEAGIDVDDITFSEPITREQAAQMVFNTIIAPMVKYTSNNNVTSLEYVTTTIATEQTISTQILSNTDTTYWNPPVYTVEFGEKNMQDLHRDFVPDEFGQPSYTWKWKNDEIGTYMDSSLLIAEYTDTVTGKTIYDLLGESTIKYIRNGNYNLSIEIDGIGIGESYLSDYYFDESDFTRTNDNAIGGTGRGVLTRVFLDTTYNSECVYISIINTYLAETSADYDSKKDQISLDVYSVDKIGQVYVKDNDLNETADQITVSGEDFDIKDLKEDEFFLVTIARNEVKSMIKPEIQSKVTLIGFKYQDYVNSSDGRYDYANTARYKTDVLTQYDKPNFKDTTYNLLFDIYGNLIGIEQNSDPDQYVFITGNDGGSSNLSTKNIDVNGVFTDGTMKLITVDTTKSDDSVLTSGSIINTWYKYTVDKNDVYTLTDIKEAKTANVTDKVAQYKQDVDGSDPFKINSRNNTALLRYDNGPSDYGTAYGTDSSVYITVSGKVITGSKQYSASSSDIIVDPSATTNAYIVNDVDSAVVGIKNVNVESYNIDRTFIEDDSTNDSFNGKPLAYPVNEIYTLYNNEKGTIIACVIFGEDAGASSSYAYVTSRSYEAGVNYEGWSEADQDWSWSREVLIDGKTTEIHEVGSSMDKLDTMIQGKWYEVRTDSDGNVKSISEVNFKNIAGKYINNPDLINNSVPDNDFVMLFAGVNDVWYNAGALYTDKNATSGLPVSENVKVVLIQSLIDKNGNKTDFAEINESYSGLNGIDNAIKALDANYNGELSVIMENGIATIIILTDRFGHTKDGSTPSVPTPPTPKKISVVPKITSNDVQVTLLADVSEDEYKSAVYEALEKEGYEITEWIDLENIKVVREGLSSNAEKGYTITIGQEAHDGDNYKIGNTPYDEV